jgi:hypothetical protein
MSGFAFDPSHPNRIYAVGPASSDAFVAKLTPDGQIVYFTYLGGQGEDSATAIAVDHNGIVYVAGSSTSADFPRATVRLYTGAHPFLFAAKLDPSGSLVYSALFGDSDLSTVAGVAVDG